VTPSAPAASSAPGDDSAAVAASLASTVFYSSFTVLKLFIQLTQAEDCHRQAGLELPDR
jgi:hypothetical protein